MTATRTDPTALDTVSALAETLTDPATASLWPTSPRARPQSLAGGAIGIALLHAERARTGHGDEATVHSWLRAATTDPLSCGPNANLFHGAPAVGFVLHAATGGTSPHLTALDERTTALTRQRLDAAHARIERGDPLVMREFDLIHGLTGLGVYHLLRHPDQPITATVLTYLTRLTRPAPGQPDHLPPWWLTSGLTGEPDPSYPHGHGNIGVAHGISAIIALLSLAILHHVSVPGTDEAIMRLCAWTDRWRQHDDDHATWWPGYITHDHHNGATPPRPRPSWCYGTAGTARAQQLAGLALHDPARTRQAENAMLTALHDPDLDAHLPDIGLCHGKAGLLQAAWRMAADSTDPSLAAALPNLTDRLRAQATALLDSPHRSTTADANNPVGDAELLDGTAGAALALHTTSLNRPATVWDTFLLLA